MQSRVPTLDLYDALALAEEIGWTTTRELNKTIEALEIGDTFDSETNRLLAESVALFKKIRDNPETPTTDAQAICEKLEQVIERRNAEMPIANLTATNG